MKFEEGRNLLDYCLNQPDQTNWMSEKRVRFIFQQLVEGVRDIHKAGLVHNDIKFLNVFLSSASNYPKVKIGDFGLAYKLAQGETMSRKCGTTASMSPEMLKKLPTDHKNDVWGLGIILYTMFAIDHPFRPKGQNAKSTEALKLLIINKPLSFEDPKWQQISSDCKDLVERLLCKDRESRPTIQEVLAHPWI